MTGARSEARITPAAEGSANVATGLPVLDHLVGELTLDVAPDTADEAVSAAGAALGAAVRGHLAAGAGWALMPADEALAAAALECTETPVLVTNVDFSDIRVGGLTTDVASRFLAELARAAGLNLHVRLLEGTEPQHVLAAIFKSVGAALGQACRPPATIPTKEGS